MITVSANSIDDLNVIIRKLRHSYSPTSNVHLNQGSLLYEVSLESKKINPIVKNLVEKLVDFCSELNQKSEVDMEQFEAILKTAEKRIVFAKQLLKIYEDMDKPSKMMVVSYVSDQLDQQSDVGEEAEINN